MELSLTAFKEMMNQLPNGIIVMDHNREIHYINDTAREDTGWGIGETVPYCSYCRGRMVEEEGERCILTIEQPVPFFKSEMAVYSSKLEEFEMSLHRIFLDDAEFHLLMLRRPVLGENQEGGYCSRLIIQETMHAQEMERRRIARELHDYVGQSIYSIFLGLEGIRHSLRDDTHETHLTKMIGVMEKTLHDIKRLCKDLRPETGCHLGIIHALKEAVHDWESLYQIDIQLRIHMEEKEKYDHDKEIHLFRVIQEAVNNAVRHGGATHIVIEMISREGMVFFKIVDNGKGFRETDNLNKGLGLKHMYERCSMLGGKIHWLTDRNHATVVEGFVSLVQKEEENRDECTNRG